MFGNKGEGLLHACISSKVGIKELWRWWFSGRILACHAGDRGSIPRQRRTFLKLNSPFIFVINVRRLPAFIEGNWIST